MPLACIGGKYHTCATKWTIGNRKVLVTARIIYNLMVIKNPDGIGLGDIVNDDPQHAIIVF